MLGQFQRHEAAKVVASLANLLEYASYPDTLSAAEVASQKASAVRYYMLLFPWEAQSGEVLLLNVAAERSRSFSKVIKRLRQLALELWPEVPPLIPGTTTDWEGLLREHFDLVEDAIDNHLVLALIDPTSGHAREFFRRVMSARGMSDADIERQIRDAQRTVAAPISWAFVRPGVLARLEPGVQLIHLEDEVESDDEPPREQFCLVAFVERDRVLVRRVTRAEVAWWIVYPTSPLWC